MHTKVNKILIGSAISFFLVTAATTAQQASSSRDADSTPSVSSAPAASMPSSANRVPTISYSNTSSSGSAGISGSRDRDFSSFGSSGGGSAGSAYPNYTQFINPQTSFWCYDTYYRAEMLFSFLSNNYPGMFGHRYFSRYYTNNEPIITSRTAIVMRVPAANARQLVTIADRLQTLRGDYARKEQGDRFFQDAEVCSLIQKARVLARQIYKYPALEYLDVGKTTDLATKTASPNTLSNLERMDSFIRMLQNQFQEVWETENPSSVSVQQLSQPSPISLAKGIEKLAGQLEKANKS